MTKVVYWKCNCCGIDVSEMEARQSNTNWVEFCGTTSLSDGDNLAGGSSKLTRICNFRSDSHFCTVDCLLTYIRERYDEYIGKKTIVTLNGGREVDD